MGCMWPTRVFCGMRCFLKILKYLKLFYFVYSPVFNSARLASEQVPFKQTETARNDLPTTRDTFCRK